MTESTSRHGERRTIAVRLPGFVADEPVGLGDLLKRGVARIGLQPCRGCEQRAARLNSWMQIHGTRPERGGE
jgi:hypothetical protein